MTGRQAHDNATGTRGIWRRIALGPVIAVVLGVVAVTAWTGVATAATRSVGVGDNFYSDSVSSNSTTTINIGDTVEWTFSGGNPHTVSSTSAEAFDSGAPQTSATFSHIFNTYGTFAYICGVHGAAMQGSVIVQAAATSTSTTVPSTNTTVPATSTPVPATAAASSTPGAATASPAPAATTAATPPASAGTPAATAESGGAGLPVTGTGSPSGSGWGVEWLIAGTAAVGSLTLLLAMRHRRS